MRFEYSLHRVGVIGAELGEMEVFAQGDTEEGEKQSRRYGDIKGQRQNLPQEDCTCRWLS